MGTIASQITSLTSVYSTVCSGADQSKHQSSASLAFVWGIHRRPVNSPHKWPVTRKMFPFDDVIMIYKSLFILSNHWNSPYFQVDKIWFSGELKYIVKLQLTNMLENGRHDVWNSFQNKEASVLKNLKETVCAIFKCWKKRHSHSHCISDAIYIVANHIRTRSIAGPLHLTRTPLSWKQQRVAGLHDINWL